MAFILQRNTQSYQTKIQGKGWRAIETADVIVCDALVSSALMAEVPAHIRRIYVGKLKGHHSMQQADISALLVEQARLGARVARLKGGDSLVFGRLGEELDALEDAGIGYQIIPGITAAAGCAASLKMPLTERGVANKLRLVTAHSCDDTTIDWAGLAQTDETLVFYMGLSMAEHISARLIEHGLAPEWPVALVQSASCPAERTVITTLEHMAADRHRHQLTSPTLIVVGRVVRRACTLSTVRQSA
ncbi:uroporphyrinogen-III C-methyltransferase [Litorivicinus lipolyticus]|uniref:uroporphyrinogen-III C-methyltransferase n=1 Tax=Litorivicinus lipolyticus TaxID=418701 RepID=UPI003B5945F0